MLRKKRQSIPGIWIYEKLFIIDDETYVPINRKSNTSSWITLF